MNGLKEDELINLIKKNERKNKRRTHISILVIVIAALLFVMYTSLSVSKKEQETQKISVVKDSIATANDSLKEINSNFKKDQSKEEIIRNKVYLFFKRRYFQDPDSVKNLFADTLKRYFLRLNLPADQMFKGDVIFWKKFPDEKYSFDSTSVAINTSDTSGSKALIRVIYCRAKNDCKEIVQELRFNDSCKIYYARDFDLAK